MSANRTDTTLELATELEWIAREIAAALQTVVASDGAHVRNAERHLIRLRFSLARVDELKQRVARTGGVFEPARLEVAISILDTHVMRAEGFCEQIAARLPRAARRRATGDAAVRAEETPAGQSEQRRAA